MTVLNKGNSVCVFEWNTLIGSNWRLCWGAVVDWEEEGSSCLRGTPHLPWSGRQMYEVLRFMVHWPGCCGPTSTPSHSSPTILHHGGDQKQTEGEAQTDEYTNIQKHITTAHSPTPTAPPPPVDKLVVKLWEEGGKGNSFLLAYS